MSEDANAEEQFMLPLPLNSDDAPEAKSDASDVAVQLDDSEGDIPAESAVRECRICKKDRQREGKDPLKIRRLPAAITQNSGFQKKSIPVQLCPECDGGAVDSAMRNHARAV